MTLHDALLEIPHLTVRDVNHQDYNRLDLVCEALHADLDADLIIGDYEIAARQIICRRIHGELVPVFFGWDA